MSFDRIAPHYAWLEWVLAGSILQTCRLAQLDGVGKVDRVLILGEGNGRFLTALLATQPQAEVTCVDRSPVMLNLARRRVAHQRLAPERIAFVQADALNWLPPAESFDLVVTHFFLDCFRPEQLEALIPSLGASLRPEGRWLLADFTEPPQGVARWRARLMLGIMYAFFRRVTALPAECLTSPDRLLAQNRFRLLCRRRFEWGLLHSDLWRKLPDSAHASETQAAAATPVGEPPASGQRAARRDGVLSERTGPSLV